MAINTYIPNVPKIYQPFPCHESSVLKMYRLATLIGSELYNQAVSCTVVCNHRYQWLKSENLLLLDIFIIVI
jgi:hypothetical protein